MLKNAVFLFIIFFSSFCFSQPTLKDTLKSNLEKIQNLTSLTRGGSSRHQSWYLEEIRNLEAENIKLRAQIAGRNPEDKQRQTKVRRDVAIRKKEDEEEVVQSKASRRGKRLQVLILKQVIINILFLAPTAKYMRIEELLGIIAF